LATSTAKLAYFAIQFVRAFFFTTMAIFLPFYLDISKQHEEHGDELSSSICNGIKVYEFLKSEMSKSTG
jgi:predicted transcriptional regulator